MPPIHSLSPAPRSAYVHVPFCRWRCGYCNFTVVAGRDDLIEDYLAALDRELSWLETPRPVDTLFLGGGTPTHLPLGALRHLLESTLKWHPLLRGHEFTVEANPGDVSAEVVTLLAEHGVTRVSLGAQSFREEKLRTLERSHTADDIRSAADIVRNRGMDLSIDLIFAAPAETLTQWRTDLDNALLLQPNHISTYGLTFEKGTRFWARRATGELTAADEERERQMYEEAIEHLSSRGFEHYEVSNFAKANKRCRHNEAYWMGDEYYAAGPGAARYVGGVRSTNHRSTTTYIRRVLAGLSPVAESEKLESAERSLELLVFALRRLEGVERRWFERKSGTSLDALLGAVLSGLVERGLIADDGHRIQLTRAGLLVSDSIMGRILSLAPRRTEDRTPASTHPYKPAVSRDGA